MNRYAIVEDNKVVNVILWDGEDPYSPEAVAVGDEVGIGWTQNSDGSFTAPPVEVVEPPQDDTQALRQSAMQKLMTGQPLTEAEAAVLVGF